MFSSQGGAGGFTSLIGNRPFDIGTRRISGVGPPGHDGGSGTLLNGMEQGDGGAFIRCTRMAGFGGASLPNFGSRKLRLTAGAAGVTGLSDGKIFHFAYGG